MNTVTNHNRQPAKRIRLHVAWMAFVCLAWSLISLGSSTSAATLTSEHEKLLANLNADDYTTRQQATQELMQGEYLSDALLNTMLDHAESDEQRHRLLSVACHQTIRKHRGEHFDQPQNGAVGVRHQARPKAYRPDSDRSAVVVLDTIVGFPGHSYLQPGDEIVAINGSSIADDVDRNDLARRVTQFQQGDTIVFDIVRHGQEKRVSFELAGDDALRAAYQRRSGANLLPRLSDAFADPWRQRRKALLKDRPTLKHLTLKPSDGED